MPEAKSSRDQRNRLWGGRFAAGPSAIMQQINASIDVDKRLYAEDIAGSQAHARMLVRRGIISAADGRKIQAGLKRIRAEIEKGKFQFKTEIGRAHV